MPTIWICNADGGNSHPVIADARVPCLPRWVRGAEATPERSHIFPDQTPYLMGPVWSPDGKRLAAVGVHANPGRTPTVLQADGSLLMELVFPPDAGPPFLDDLCWSPDGTRLAVAWRGAAQGHAVPSYRSGICTLAPRGDGADKESSGRVLVNVSPQGPRLGGPIVSASGLQTWYSHGSVLPSRVPKTFTSLAWSPDGRTLAFSSDMGPSGAFYVYTISADGGEPRRVEGTRSAWPQQVMWRPR